MKRVWDVPVRVMHLTFIAGVAGAWLTRGAELSDWHAAFGYAALLAALFRIAWGFIGPTHSRFANFSYSPSAAMRYIREALQGKARHYTGHNPAGSWSVYVLLALIVATGITGVVASAGMHSNGPLAGAVSFATGDTSFALHEVLSWVILAIAASHLLGVIWGSYVHRENLAMAMVTGNKVNHGDPAPPAPARSALGVALAIAAIAGSGYFLFQHAPADLQRRDAAEKIVEASTATQPWSKECGSCHLAYPPGLLPTRSWVRMLEEQDKHFAEDLGLSAAAVAKLTQAANTPAAAWGPWAISASAPTSQAPQRITELDRWRAIHHRVPDERFKAKGVAGKHDCSACHRDAASGIFHPRMIQTAKQGTSP
ncbi:MAG: cytochrome b/b6 domain-containing protein [Usitatibacter sp.]